MRLLLAAILCSPAALGAEGLRAGLYPLSFGQPQLEETLAAQLRDGAVALPGVKAFDLVPHSACAPDEPACLAEAARTAKLDALISADVAPSASGYSFHLRAVAADGKLRGEREGQIRGGPLDLEGALEHGVCELLGAAPCEGELRILGAPAPVTVDGVERGTPPVMVKLAVGRHVVKAGADERRVRISYASRLELYLRDGKLADQPAAPVEAVAAAPVVAQPRAQASRALLGSGIGLLAAAVGVGLYAHANPSSAEAMYGAYALAATGAGAVVAGGLLLALTPTGVQGQF